MLWFRFTGSWSSTPSCLFSWVIKLFLNPILFRKVSHVYKKLFKINNTQVNINFEFGIVELGWNGSKWVITLGGILALIASLFGAMFPLPRILMSMAQDGLIFREFSFVSQSFKTPVIATLCAAILTALFAALFDLTALVSMLSIGVLLAYTIVAISIIILRYGCIWYLFSWSLTWFLF